MGSQSPRVIVNRKVRKMPDFVLGIYIQDGTADALRIIALVLLAIATGGMFRLYLSQSRMPWLAFLAVCSATFSMAATIIFKIIQTPDLGFRWWVTPPVILYSVFIIMALRRFLVIRRPK